MRSRLTLVAVAPVLAIVSVALGGCGGSVPTVSRAASATAVATSEATPSVGPVAADPDLLEVLPPTGHGLTLTYDPATTSRVAADPGLAVDARALAVGLYTTAGANASAGPADDLAVVSVVRLRDPSRDDEWFRAWRDSYDASACASAGGVARHAQAEINGRTVFIGSCAGGAFTYHTRIDEGAIVVSLTSVGQARLGQTLMERLDP